jgi:putative membrane protein
LAVYAVQNKDGDALMMYGFDMMDGWSGMWFGPLFMILIPVLGIALIVWLVRAASRGGGSGPAANLTPQEILDERFAKGEIDAEDYGQRRNALKQ